jgi:hypothetical protein
VDGAASHCGHVQRVPFEAIVVVARARRVWPECSRPTQGGTPGLHVALATDSGAGGRTAKAAASIGKLGAIEASKEWHEVGK